MSLDPITNYVEQAIAHLASQYRDKPLIAGFIESIIKPYQGLEDALVQTLNFRGVDTAIGQQLDGLGSIVGEDRRGRNDDEYRLAIKLRIAINTCRGTPEDVMNIFLLVTRSNQVMYHSYYPAEVELYGDYDYSQQLIGAGPDAFAMAGGPDGLGFGDVFDPDVGGTFAALQLADMDFIFYILQSALPAGVLLGHIGYNDGPLAFAMDGGPDGLGFGDVFDSTVGGMFATILV